MIMRHILLIIFLIISSSIYSKTTRTRISWGNFIQSVILGNNLSWTQNSTWDNGIPVSGDIVIIRLPTNFNISTETLTDLEIHSELDVLTNNTLRVTNDVRLVGNQIIVNGDFIIVGDVSNYGSVTEASGGNISGNFTYERWVDRCNKWSLYGGPFDATLNDYADSATGQMIYTGFPNSDYPTFGFVNTWIWDEDHVATGGWILPDGNTTIPRGSGVWYWNSDTVFLSLGPPIPQQWKVATRGSIDFNTTFNFPIQYTNTGDNTSDGWNLVANPYPSTIDWNDGGFTRTNVDNAIYEFSTCSQTYASYVGGIGTNGGDQYISPLQGFYIHTNGTSPVLSSTNTVIGTGKEALFKTTNPLENVLRIEFENDEIIVRVNDLATEGFNGDLDAYKFEGGTIYSKLDTTMYSINSVNDSTEVIPLYTVGGGTFNFSDLQTWESNYELYLEDLTLGTMTDINSVNQYTFTESNPLFTHRFNIHIIDDNILLFIDGHETVDVDKTITKITNFIGQEVNEDYKGLVVYFYDDGSYQKFFKK